MNTKNFIKALGFSPKENASEIYIKKYSESYAIEVDFEKQIIDYGNKIKAESKTTQNFSQPENFVVLECVNRLLETGYKPENIILEKTWGAGHGTSGRLDICVTREDGSEYLLIECKTYGNEFGKEFSRMKKDGGQLFTYFKFSNKADVIMLYASELRGNEIDYRNEIVKIEDDYRTGDVKDFYDKWNKLTKNNGVWENPPYNFKPKALTINKLVEIKHEDSSFIFNRFLEILRHNVVSDKPNAFNKIFNLFLCKIYDEKDKEGTDEELEFQWIEGKDDDISFQLRLTDLYKSGMESFLEKTVTDFSDEEFENQYASLFKGNDELKKKFKENVIYKLRLEKNNEFAIKEVYDERSFKENAKVVKEIVQLLENFKIRYTQKQQYLSDFFELLLTTGLKQESGQFFTPVPVAQFVIRSLPIDTIIKEKLTIGKKDDLLPYIIDYASGSGHFITESMHEIQHLLMNETNGLKLKSEAKSFIEYAKVRHFDWAEKYIYGIEKDYRLVKVGKVGCYLHGDGLANVVHSDGLANFKHNDYKDKLRITDKDFPKENKQFDVIVSNPPYSVSAFKSASIDYYNQNDFDLFDSLTDNSSEIEALFIERTKQLLKDGGVAGIILPRSILDKTGIYTKAREILLQYFEIIGIVELGSNTFMATDTKTVILFLRRRNNYDCINLKSSVKLFFTNLQDITINGIEKPVSKYINHVWEGLSFDDYVSLLKKQPSPNVKQSEIYKEYRKKIKTRNKDSFWKQLLERETEKLFYFILAYPQRLVLIKTGEKEAEKRFLGYKFSDRKETQGISPYEYGKTIEECTKLYDVNTLENTKKVSYYIYNAFKSKYDLKVDEGLKSNVFYHNFLDLITFSKDSFDIEISLSVKEKIEYPSKYPLVKLADFNPILESGKRPRGGVSHYTTGVPSLGGEHIGTNGKMNYNKLKFVPTKFYEEATMGKVRDNDILICKDGALTGKIAWFEGQELPFENMMINEHVFLLRLNDLLLQKFIFYVLYSKNGQIILKSNVTGTAQGGLNRDNLLNIKIPLPTSKELINIIVSEINEMEEKSKTFVIQDFDKEVEMILKKYL